MAATAAAVAVPTFIPARALGKDGATPPSERIVVGTVGWGMQGPHNTKMLMAEKDCQMVAACDLDSRPLKQAVDAINKHYGNTDCKAYSDFRELFARTDIDAMVLSVPDHWHAITSIEACRQKKDIFGEKPLARTIAEQQAIVKAVQKHQRIWQTGSWQRSQAHFHKAAEIVRNGLIGRVKHVEVGLPSGHVDFKKTKDKLVVSEPPPELKYDMWVGPSQWMPYIEGRVHMNWRWNYNFGGGQLLDWVGHHVDIAHWGLGFDDAGGPVEVAGTGEFPPRDAVWNTATKYRCELKYADGTTMTIAGGDPAIKMGTKWIGENGWVWVDRGNSFEASNPEWKQWTAVPDDLRKVKLYESRHHWRNFLDCVRSRKPTVTPVETAHRSAIPGHLGLIAMMVGRKITWDPKKERIVGDKEASRLLSREYRKPWKLG